MFDRSDVRKFAPKDRDDENRMQQQRMMLLAAKQSAVRLEHITGDPVWDTYLSYLEAAIEGAQAQADQARRILEDSQIVDHDTILKAKVALNECKAMILAWETALSLPKDIIAAGDEAASILERMSADDDAAA